jgi:hypothetical protein
MKKTLLIFTLFLCSLTIYASKLLPNYYAEIYANCNGKKIHIGSIYESGLSYTINWINPLMKLCDNCNIYYETNPLYPINLGMILNNSNNVEFIHYIGTNKNESNLTEYSGGLLHSFIINGDRINRTGTIQIVSSFPYTNNFDFTIPNTICKGECIPITYNFPIGFNYLVDGSISKINNFSSSPIIRPGGGNQNYAELDIRDNCLSFNEVGEQIVSIEYKDNCGEIKTVEKKITVLDCPDFSSNISCEECCTTLANFASNPTKIGDNIVIPNDVKGCLGSVTFYYEDGTSFSVTSNTNIIPLKNSNGSKLISFSHFYKMSLKDYCPCMASYNFNF